MTERERRNYFLRRMTGGKSAVARAADRVLFLCLTFLVALLIWYAHPLRLVLASLTTAVVGVVQYLVLRARQRGFERRETARLSGLLFRDSLMTMPYAELCRYLEPHADGAFLVLRQTAAVQTDDLIRCWRRNEDAKTLFATAELTPDAARFARDRLPGLRVCGGREVHRLLGDSLPVGAEQVDAHIAGVLAEEKRRRRQRARLPAGAATAWKYLAVGLLLFGLSFVTRFALYYRLLASAALLLAGLTGVPGLIGRSTQKNAPP